VYTNLDMYMVPLVGAVTGYMPVEVRRHGASDRRLLYGITHFNQATTGLGPQSRVEAAKVCADFLNRLAASYPDSPAILLSGDFNATTSMYDLFSERGLEASNNKATTTEHAGQSSWHGDNVDRNTNANWIDEH